MSDAQTVRREIQVSLLATNTHLDTLLTLANNSMGQLECESQYYTASTDRSGVAANGLFSWEYSCACDAPPCIASLVPMYPRSSP